MRDDYADSSFDIPGPRDNTSTHDGAASSTCPACQSQRIVARDPGKKAGASIGTIAGAAGGISAALSGVITGAEIGVALGAAVIPPIAPLGAVAGAIIGGLSGGIAGCTVGAALGEAVDESILRNRRCLDCAHTFRCPTADRRVSSSPFSNSSRSS